MENKTLIDNAIKLCEEYTSSQLLLKSMDLFKITRKNILRKILFLVIQICLAYNLSKAVNAIEILKSSIITLNEVLIALFGIVFTGYALFQALIGKKMLIYMVGNNSKSEKDISYLKESNLYFVKFMLIQFLGITINILLIIILNLLPQYWSLFSDNNMNVFSSTVIITFIFHYYFEVLWETKSFVFNVFQLFNIHAMSRVIENQNDDE